MSDVAVKFSADIGSFNSAMTAAASAMNASTAKMRTDAVSTRAELLKMQEQLAGINAEAKRSADAAESMRKWALAVGVVVGGYELLKGAANLAADGLNKLNAAATSQAPREAVIATAQAVTSGIASWRAYAESQVYTATTLSFVRLENDGLVAALGRASMAISQYVRQVELAKSNLIDLSRTSLNAAGALEHFDAAMAAEGITGREGLEGFTRELADIPGMSNAAAAALEATFAGLPDITARVNKELVDLVTNQNQGADAAKALGEEMANAIRAGEEPSDVFAKQIQKQIELEEDTLRPLREKVKLLGNVPILSNLMALGYKTEITAAEAQLAQLNLQLAAHQKNISAIGRTKAEFTDAEKAAATIVTALKPGSVLLDEYNAKLATLTQAMKDMASAGPGGGISRSLKEATGDATELLKAFEGFIPNAKWDVNHQRVGYGSDTKTAADGSTSEVKAGDTTTEADAQRDLSRRVVELQTQAAAEIGASWDKLSDNTKASFTSMAYNYATSIAGFKAKAPDMIAAAKTGDDSAVANAILAHKMDNGGQNQQRRQTEAANITDPDSIGAGGDKRAASLQAASEASNKLKDDAQATKDAMAGGNAVAIAQAQILARNADGEKDMVKDAQDVVEAWKKDLENSNQRLTKVAAINGLHQAQVALAEKLLALAQSKQSLDAAGNTTAKQNLESAKQTLALELQAAGGDGAAKNAALAKMKAAQTAYDSDVKARAEAALTSQFEIDSKTLEEKKAKLKTELEDHQISNQGKLAADLALADQQTALETKYYAAIKALKAADTLEYQQADNKLTQITQEGQTRRQQVIAQDNKAIAQSYQQTFSTLGSTMTSSIMGMIQGTTSFRQMMQKLALDVVQMFVSAGVKMVMNWLAHQAQMLMGTVTGTAGQTAAVTAGATAQAAAMGAGAATGVAAQKAASTVAITTDAGTAGAGIAAWLAPFIGPAAVGAGEAGAASVMSFNAFDVGAWNIPQNQLAMVHQGETIMTAGQSAGLRNVINAASNQFNGSGQGGASGGDTHVHAHFNVSAMDSSSVKSFFGNHSRTIMKALNGAVKNGDHLGLRALAGA